MSKISQLAMELDESAVELGFENYEQAERAGYRPDYNTGKLYLHEPTTEAVKEMGEAHKVWLKEKETVLEELKELHDHLIELGYDTLANTVFDAIKFIKKGEI